MKTIFSLALFMALVGGGVALYGQYRQGQEVINYRTADVERGDLVVTVGATGTLEPEELIDVGAQVVGRIKEFGRDPRGETDPAFKDKRIDYGSTVDEGTILAVIDDSVYLAQRNQAQAAFERAKADLIQLEARLAQTDAEWQRAQRLRTLSLDNVSLTGTAAAGRPALQIRGISDSDFILAKANFAVAKANIDVGKATVAQQQSALDLAETNHSYTIIKSPVQGTIIDRRVNIGQTVVASLNAPSLFLIATDLRRMQVWASVNEADIGELKVGAPVSFTVDAFPDDVFTGSIEQIRLNAKMTQNVVTYTVVIATANPDLKLLPYLTADVNFEIARRDDVLSVPNAALRFKPRAAQITVSPFAPSETAETIASSGATDDSETSGTVWIRSDHKVYPLSVATGVNDGSRTEISGDHVEEGLEIVLGELQAGETPQVNNPFAPKMPGTRPRS